MGCLLSSCQQVPERKEVRPAQTQQRAAVQPPPPPPPAQGSSSSNNVRGLKTGFGFVDNAMSNVTNKVADKVVSKTGMTPEALMESAKQKAMEAKDIAMAATSDWQQQLTQQMDTALSNVDNKQVNSLLDSALANKLLSDKNTPGPLKRAASQIASRQLQEAVDASCPRRLKGALVAAKRLNATGVPEFPTAVQKYREIKKLPAGWDVSRMVLHRKGDRMVAKLPVQDPSVMAKFQLLLDSTHRNVTTRDRMGQPVPLRLELVSVHTVTNEDLWGDFMARREAIRQELVENPSDFQPHTADTTVTSTGGVSSSSSAGTVEEVAASLAADFAEPLLPDVNEVFLFHGTKQDAPKKITTENFKVNLAGSNVGTLFGRGLYFAENGTKSDEYTWPNDEGCRTMLLCRVVLGRAFYVDTKETDPRACEGACLAGKYHSILGDRKKCRGTFREFVVYDEEQVYPNYILSYRRVEAPEEGKAKKQIMQVRCPPGATPGATLEVTSPQGVTLHVVVPAGAKPGTVFPVQY